MKIDNTNLAIVIPTHNVVIPLDLCLATFYHYVQNPPRIIIVDMESDDGTINTINKYIEQGCDIIHHSIPTTGAQEDCRACSYASRELCDTEYVLFMHADIEFKSDVFWDFINIGAGCDLGYCRRNWNWFKFDNPGCMYIQLPSPDTYCLLFNRKRLLKCEDEGYPIYTGLTCIGATDQHKPIYIGYDSFGVMFDYLLQQQIKMVQMDSFNLIRHYGGLSTLSLGFIPGCDKPQVKVYLDILLSFLQNKLDFIGHSGFDFPVTFDNRCEQILKMRDTL